jgi:hypothetical protein
VGVVIYVNIKVNSFNYGGTESTEEFARGRGRSADGRLEFERRDGGNRRGEIQGIFELLTRGEGLDLGSNFSGHDPESFFKDAQNGLAGKLSAFFTTFFF